MYKYPKFKKEINKYYCSQELEEMAGEHAQMHELQQTVQGLTQALNNVIQAGARNGAGDLYGNFQRINPPRFNGTPDPDEAENWVKAVSIMLGSVRGLMKKAG